MSLDWSEVKKRYEKGAEVPTVAGSKTLTVTGCDDEAIYIENPLWKDKLTRANLEKGVELIEQGIIDRNPGLFVEDYRVYVTDERVDVGRPCVEGSWIPRRGHGFHRQMLKPARPASVR